MFITLKVMVWPFSTVREAGSKRRPSSMCTSTVRSASPRWPGSPKAKASPSSPPHADSASTTAAAQTANPRLIQTSCSAAVSY